MMIFCFNLLIGNFVGIAEVLNFLMKFYFYFILLYFSLVVMKNIILKLLTKILLLLSLMSKITLLIKNLSSIFSILFINFFDNNINFMLKFIILL